MRAQLIFLSLMMFGIALGDDTPSSEELLNQISAIENSISDLINTTCTETGQCKTLPIGAKACGGPTHYIVFSSSTNEIALQLLINEYTAFNIKYNEVTNAISDCSLVIPPSLNCVDGQCLVID
jgi:hypothetical protein